MDDSCCGSCGSDIELAIGRQSPARWGVIPLAAVLRERPADEPRFGAPLNPP